MNNIKLAYLKVKIKSLSVEQQIIRQEKNKIKKSYKRVAPEYRSDAQDLLSLLNGLNDHRTQVVRPILRDTHIAYGLLKGRRMSQIEHGRPEDFYKQVPSIEKMVKRFGTPEDVKRLY